MPAIKNIFNTNHSKILIWHITEKLVFLENSITLNNNEYIKYNCFKKETHKKQFLSKKLLLKLNHIEDIFYNEQGQPFLEKEYISISHNNEYVMIGINSQKQIGIDVETITEKIEKVFPRICNKIENQKFEIKSIIIKTIFWCAKEALYKIFGGKVKNYTNDINITDIDLNSLIGKGFVIYNKKKISFHLEFIIKNNSVFLISSPES